MLAALFTSFVIIGAALGMCWAHNVLPTTWFVLCVAAVAVIVQCGTLVVLRRVSDVFRRKN